MEAEIDEGTRASNELAYRPEVDGLRALAVLSVFAYHLETPGFAGGFAGVDVFFVISGYLITRLIKKESDLTAAFDLPRFYLRRARRILPALFATLIGAALPALVFFQGRALARFAGSVVTATVSLSNFYFWAESGYFDTASTLKPLLHTWSLGVEEQFYLVWPLFLLMVVRPRKTLVAPAWIAGVGLVSLCLNMIVVAQQLHSPEADGADGLAAIFYLAPFRVFEFAIGALLVWARPLGGRWARLHETATIVGLGAMIFACTTYTNATIFPSVNALPPAIGAALVIWGGRGRIGGLLLSNKAVVWIGKISYSLYLVHWPLIVFYRLHKQHGDAPSVLTLADKLLIVALTLGLAAAMYRCVETPFRYAQKARTSIPPAAFALASVLCALAILMPGVVIWKGGGWLADARPNVALPAGAAAGVAPAAHPTPAAVKAPHETISVETEHKFTWRLIVELNKPYRGAGRKVMVIGDSQGGDFLNLLRHHPNFSDADVVALPVHKYCQVIFSEAFYESGDWRGQGDPPRGQFEQCQELRRMIKADARIAVADELVLAFSWFPQAAKYLAAEIAEYKKMGAQRVFVVGRKYQSGDAGVDAPNISLDAASEYSSDTRSRTKLDKANQATRSAATGATFIDLVDCICFDGRCKRLTAEGSPVFYDRSHFTEAGARDIGQSPRFLAMGDRLLGGTKGLENATR